MWEQDVTLTGLTPCWVHVVETCRDGTQRCLGGFQTTEPNWRLARHDIIAAAATTRLKPWETFDPDAEDWYRLELVVS